MKKIIYNHYGDADELTLIETGIPEITPTTLLVKIKAASLNPLDWKILAGEMKLFARSGFPRGIGIDFSGIVEETGSTISKFKKGDAVFGSVDQFKGGALSEYALVSEKDIAIKPAGISFEKAAAIPVVGFAALQMVDQLITIRQGTELLVNGATGGIGMFLVQIAKSKGAVVTAVVSKNGKALAEKWGSDHVIDYREENVLENKKQYDVVVDLSGKMPFAKAKRIMKPSSVYVNTVPGPRQIIASLLHNLFSKKKYKVLLSKPSVSDLKTLAEYVSGGMEVVIGKRYEITSFKEAYTEVPAHGVLGKAVICMPD